MINSIIPKHFLLTFILLILIGCSEEVDSPANPSPSDSNVTSNQGVKDTAIYFFKEYNLMSLNLSDTSGTFLKVSNNNLTREIYSIAYNESDSTFFGYTHYYYFNDDGTSYESYNPASGVREKVYIDQDPRSNYSDVILNTKHNKLIPIKPGQTYEVIFQELNLDSGITYESAPLALGFPISDFIYIESIDAFIAAEALGKHQIRIAVVDANTYALRKVITSGPAVSPYLPPFRSTMNWTGLKYDKANGLLYYLRDEGLYEINPVTESFRFIDTDFFPFILAKYPNIDLSSSSLKTFFYPPTKEMFFCAVGKFDDYESRMFAVSIITKKTREIHIGGYDLGRVYGFAIKQ